MQRNLRSTMQSRHQDKLHQHSQGLNSTHNHEFKHQHQHQLHDSKYPQWATSVFKTQEASRDDFSYHIIGESGWYQSYPDERRKDSFVVLEDVFAHQHTENDDTWRNLLFSIFFPFCIVILEVQECTRRNIRANPIQSNPIQYIWMLVHTRKTNILICKYPQCQENNLHVIH